MKKLKKLMILAIFVLLGSCSTNVKFPISSDVPAAVITAKKSRDNQKNIALEIKAKYLASADRLNPPGNNYSVWIVTSKFGVKNVGQLRVDNGKKSTFKTVTPFDFDEVFITVEKKGDLQYPEGNEIARTKI